MAALGCPLPLDEHAISVSLPVWQDVVGYEEGEARVVNAMRLGYPRFKIHSVIDYLVAEVKAIVRNGHFNDMHCMMYPTVDTSIRFAKFLLSDNTPDVSLDIYLINTGFMDVHAVFFNVELKQKAKAFWQHTGEIVSSRLAEHALLYFTKSRGPSVTEHYSLNATRISSSDSINFGSSNFDNKDDSCPSDVYAILKNRIAGLVGVSNLPGEVILTISGMSSIYTALRLTRAEHAVRMAADGACVEEDSLQDTQVVVFGFPYLDTLKMMNRKELNPGGAHFFGLGDANDLASLEVLLSSQKKDRESGRSRAKVIAVFTEFPSNPLLRSPDLAILTKLARVYDFLLIVDDTIATYANVDLLNPIKSGVQVDILCSSLSKSFSGVGDVLAGALVINPRSPRANALRRLVQPLEILSPNPICTGSTLATIDIESTRFEAVQRQLNVSLSYSDNVSVCIPAMYYADAVVLERNSRDFLLRTRKCNDTAAALVCWLRQLATTASSSGYSSGIATVYYSSPSYEGADGGVNDSSTGTIYEAVAKATDKESIGYGCLFSVVFDLSVDVKKFYDALEVAKGPSLGTNFTLVCPYTLLAHYTELPWAASFGVEKELIRVSVGLEEFEDLKARFELALMAARLPPAPSKL